MEDLGQLLKRETFEASAPCRVDMGGTFDLSTFYLPLQHLRPCTFNMALNLRTHVKLTPHEDGRILIRSRGFDDFEVDADAAPFDHPVGLMLAITAHFNVPGVAVDIHSTSPPRSALGGSSVAAVAMIWAFAKARAFLGHPMPDKAHVAVLAHAIEQSVAGVPCGQQDQLAAVFGGINGWEWQADANRLGFKRRILVAGDQANAFSRNILVAYCGQPHESRDINSTWVREFIGGRHRAAWQRMAGFSRKFVDAVASGDLDTAGDTMNAETRLRRQLTPDVLDTVGTRLVDTAIQNGCGARFTGAGGGGCVWALGDTRRIDHLRGQWQSIVERHRDACLLETAIDTDGVL